VRKAEQKTSRWVARVILTLGLIAAIGVVVAAVRALAVHDSQLAQRITAAGALFAVAGVVIGLTLAYYLIVVIASMADVQAASLRLQVLTLADEWTALEGDVRRQPLAPPGM
jgi:hypothetical protein